MAPTASPPSRRHHHRPADKRQAILDSAVRLIAHSGLHNTPMSALARDAGVAAGTLYLYFPSKEAMINALYLELLEERGRATAVAPSIVATGKPREGFEMFWHRLARWHLDHPEKANLIHQCQASSILTDETRAIEQRMHAEGLANFDDAVARGTFRKISVQVFWALVAGPIFVLAQMRDTGEIEITDALLDATFDGVCRSVVA
ncbi:MAG TPA: TetR/AcrR family transcriptional regulator [Gemmatimonadaceae bacterium]|jgi:AcrR family transcriptional regulator|nr:TetR/AcrR family transcriptional regulator [Gemmatimonadaceae bacterium]